MLHHNGWVFARDQSGLLNSQGTCGIAREMFRLGKSFHFAELFERGCLIEALELRRSGRSMIFWLMLAVQGL